MIGHVTPDLFGNIESYLTTKYYIKGWLTSQNPIENFVSNPDERLRYTKITLNTPSKYLTDDLWMSQGAPPEINVANWVIEYSGYLLLTTFVIYSLFASVIAGKIALRARYIQLRILSSSNSVTALQLSV